MVRILREICGEQGIACAAFCGDWVFRLKKNGRAALIFGYNFGINGSVAAKICDDKCAASELLLHSGIPAAEHHFFMAPGNLHYVGEDGNWGLLTGLLERHGALVCKTNDGTGGNCVFLVRSQAQLEDAALKIFRQARAMAVSPFYEIRKEYRVIVLCGEAKLLYSKNIPALVGDGVSTVCALLARALADTGGLPNCAEVTRKEAQRVLAQGEAYQLGWKFNLGQGAAPLPVEDEGQARTITGLALRAARALSIAFASVDIIETGGGYRVLEINSGVMMENFIEAAPGNYEAAKEIYREAVLAMLAE